MISPSFLEWIARRLRDPSFHDVCAVVRREMDGRYRGKRYRPQYTLHEIARSAILGLNTLGPRLCTDVVERFPELAPLIAERGRLSQAAARSLVLWATARLALAGEVPSDDPALETLRQLVRRSGLGRDVADALAHTFIERQACDHEWFREHRIYDLVTQSDPSPARVYEVAQVMIATGQATHLTSMLRIPSIEERTIRLILPHLQGNGPRVRALLAAPGLAADETVWVSTTEGLGWQDWEALLGKIPGREAECFARLSELRPEAAADALRSGALVGILSPEALAPLLDNEDLKIREAALTQLGTLRPTRQRSAARAR